MAIIEDAIRIIDYHVQILLNKLYYKCYKFYSAIVKYANLVKHQ